MTNRFIGALPGLRVLIGTLAIVQAAGQVSGGAAGKAGTWNPPRLSDGQPNVQGMWITAQNSVFNLTEPVQDDGPPGRGGGRGGGRRPISRVVDPPDHVIPYQPWAKEKQLGLQAHKDGKGEYVDPQIRCLPSPIRGSFWQDFQVLQYPGYIVFEYEGYHAFRIIPLDGRPHPGPGIKLWMGDSRGHWEGTTLVVDETNNNSKGRLSREGDFASANLHATERFTFLDATHMRYEATMEDPTVYTKPWKIGADFIPKRDSAGYEQWEEACHEGERDADLSDSVRSAK